MQIQIQPASIWQSVYSATLERYHPHTNPRIRKAASATAHVLFPSQVLLLHQTSVLIARAVKSSATFRLTPITANPFQALRCTAAVPILSMNFPPFCFGVFFSSSSKLLRKKMMVRSVGTSVSFQPLPTAAGWVVPAVQGCVCVTKRSLPSDLRGKMEELAFPTHPGVIVVVVCALLGRCRGNERDTPLNSELGLPAERIDAQRVRAFFCLLLWFASLRQPSETLRSGARELRTILRALLSKINV